MADLNSWVSDKLHELVGISDRSIAEFMVGLCKKSKSPSEFVDKIRDTGTIDVDDKVGPCIVLVSMHIFPIPHPYPSWHCGVGLVFL